MYDTQHLAKLKTLQALSPEIMDAFFAFDGAVTHATHTI